MVKNIRDFVILCIVMFVWAYLLFTSDAFGADLYQLEKDHTKAWCDKNKGYYEVVLPDRTRCDCITRLYAIEVEYAYNWKEAIGQSLHYAGVVAKEPGIALILRKNGDYKYYQKLMQNIRYWNLPINVWIIDSK